ncbi:MAG: LPS-assembly protein LptD [Pirellulales bacterium]|nr:LPS-assembly protein LptD [Pirellulales bacterium]
MRSSADVRLPTSNEALPIEVTAQTAQRWTQGNEEVWVLRGKCQILQGGDTSTSDEAVVWINQTPGQQSGLRRAVAYLEGHVSVKRSGSKDKSTSQLDDQSWIGKFESSQGVAVHVDQVAGAPSNTPELYRRAMARRMPQADQAVRRTQYTQYDSIIPPQPDAPQQAATRRIRFRARSNVEPNARFTRDPASGQLIGVVSGGVTLIVDGIPKVGTIDVSADRLVLWTVASDNLNVQSDIWQDEGIPLELYIEGNIVFRRGQQVIHADQMYYDVRGHRGVVLDAELLSEVPKYEGKLRLNTKVLQQLDANHFIAQDSFLTSSRMGKPGYRIEVGNVSFEQYERQMFDPTTGQSVPDPDPQGRVVGRDTFVYFGDVPIFYWPKFATEFEDPSLFIRRARLKNDNIFGNQILTDWNGYQLFGVENKPAGTEFDISLDYMSKRGFGHGTTFTYARPDFFGLGGPAAGLADYWGINDRGEDNLGRGQRRLPLDKNYRYRLFWQHRQRLSDRWQLSAELGWISDRNFLEQYYEREWDELKDESTGVELRHAKDNVTWSFTADARLNGFFTQTEWYPRMDHFCLGQPLFGNAVSWFEHTQIGYGNYKIADAPRNQPQFDVFAPLPWEVAARGERLVTTQELDWPLQLGPVRAVPYALGQLAHWGEDVTGDDLQRASWQAGVRASMPMWRVDPGINSDFWNVHGLAHKIVFDAELAFAQSNRNMTQLPLYDPLDDDSIEAFRRRMAFLTFGTGAGGVPAYPAQFDPRYYALRTGLSSWVTSPSAEVFDDMTTVRLGMRHRWQTKRGMPGQRHIIDWITFDSGAVFYPDDARDNFGQALGLVNYDFTWHLGDRLTLASDGLFDFFNQGQKIVTVGGFLSRPPRGSLYLGLRVLDGPVSSQIVNCAYTYRMSPKWISSLAMSFDLGSEGNIGQQFTVTRIGESLLVSAGFNVDASRGNVGAMLAIEPRFLPKNRLGHSGGAIVPAAGAYGLE